MVARAGDFFLLSQSQLINSEIRIGEREEVVVLRFLGVHSRRFDQASVLLTEIGNLLVRNQIKIQWAGWIIEFHYRVQARFRILTELEKAIHKRLGCSVTVRHGWPLIENLSHVDINCPSLCSIELPFSIGEPIQ